MLVHIRAVARPGLPGAWRAGRFWPSAESVSVEVLDQTEDPPQIDEDVLDDKGHKTGTRKIHDPKRIGKKSFQLLKDDGRLSILNDGESQVALSQAALDAAKGEAAKAGARAAELETENATLKARVSELEKQLAEAASGAKKK